VADFQAGGFTLQNTHPSETFPAGTWQILLDRGSTCMDADLVAAINQDHIRLARPNTPQALTPGVKSTLFDFAFNLRPNAGFAISPTTGPTNAAGALLPAA
jgi:hypothetical protein